MLLTVQPAGFHQLRAAGMTARCLWSVRHGSVLPRKTSLAEVTVGTDLVVIYIQQSQPFDDSNLFFAIYRTPHLLLHIIRHINQSEAVEHSVYD